MSINKIELLRRGVADGLYDWHHISHDFILAKRKRGIDKNGSRPYKAAYLLGFFMNSENHEIPAIYRRLVISAERRYGQLMRSNDIYVQKRD